MSAKTTLYACAVYVTRGKPDVGNFPACGSPGLVTPGLSLRRAYRRAYVASPRLTTTDVGLTPRLAYARIVHMAPGEDPSSEIFLYADDSKKKKYIKLFVISVISRNCRQY